MNLTQDEQEELVTLLSRLPNKSDAVRRQLLAGVPTEVQDNIEFAGAPGVHIRNIVYTVTDPNWDPLSDGSRPVLTVIDNAIRQVRGSRLAGDLQGFRTRVAGGAAPGSGEPRRHPAARAAAPHPLGKAATPRPAPARSGTLAASEWPGRERGRHDHPQLWRRHARK